MKTPKIWKICVIGDRYVGKTALIKRYVFNTFAEETKETIESKAFRKKAGDTLLMIWDISVYEKHVERILSGAKAILILGDITRGETYKTMKQIANFIDEPRAHKIFVGNKNDMKYTAEFWKEDMQTISDEFESPYYFTSAKTGENVDIMFKNILNEIYT